MPALVAGIHVLIEHQQERRGWPGLRPAMTKKISHFKPLKTLIAF
jgi:hypothetical protein